MYSIYTYIFFIFRNMCILLYIYILQRWQSWKITCSYKGKYIDPLDQWWECCDFHTAWRQVTLDQVPILLPNPSTKNIKPFSGAHLWNQKGRFSQSSRYNQRLFVGVRMIHPQPESVELKKLFRDEKKGLQGAEKRYTKDPGPGEMIKTLMFWRDTTFGNTPKTKPRKLWKNGSPI